MGFYAAQTIARKYPDYLIVLSSRTDPKHAADAINKSLNQNNTVFIPIDLCDSKSVRAYARDWVSGGYPKIQSLLLNAALQFPGALVMTDEGIEKTFAITHVGHALLFHLLYQHLAPKARVVITASGVHDPALKTGMPKPIYTSAEALAHPPAKIANGDGRRHYVNAKLANILWAYALQRRLDEQGHETIVNAMDPGLMPGSGLAREYSPALRWLWNTVFPRIIPVLRLAFGTDNIHTPAESGAALARLAVGDDVANVKGRYFEGIKEIKSSVESYEVEKQDDLWDWTVNYLAGDEEELIKFQRFSLDSS